jgi:hypothetical protein
MTMLSKIHPIAGLIAFLTILTFWLSTVTSELFGSRELIVEVKEGIPWGFLILVPALATTALSGIRLAGSSSHPAIVKKRRRMPIIAGNGLLILIPASLCLAKLASAGDFGALFYGVQAIELIAGALNLSLMSLNIRDGIRLSQRFKTSARQSYVQPFV